MESWEILFAYVALWFTFGLSYMYLFDNNLNMIALVLLTLTHVFMGMIVWFGDVANPTIQVLPSLMTTMKVDMKTLFMGIWGIVFVTMSLLLDRFRRLHDRFTTQGLPIDLGSQRASIHSLYAIIASTEFLLLLQLFLVIWYHKDDIETMIHKRGFNNMLILYFTGMVVAALIECNMAYNIYKVH